MSSGVDPSATHARDGERRQDRFPRLAAALLYVGFELTGWPVLRAVVIEY